MKKNIDLFLISETVPIIDALSKLDTSGFKILMVADDVGILKGVLTDGDIRRRILKTGGLEGSVGDVCNKEPIYVFMGTDTEEIKTLLLKKRIEAVPVLSSDKKIMGIIFWDDIFSKDELKQYRQIDSPVVIMAGGKGTRLEPFTKILPKSLMPIGDKTIIQIIMDEFAKFGMRNFILSINHKAKLIKAYFEELNSEYGISYIEEEEPLGTAGSLKLLEDKIASPFFVSNCDIIIYEDYSKIHEFHKDGGYSLTLVASMQRHKIPYGVCEIEDGGMLKAIKEKPEYNLLVNTGMYLLNHEVLNLIPGKQHYHITDLINELLKNAGRVGVYPVSEKSWLDVGQWSEYQKNLEFFKNL